jgi:hypothetical protein
MEIYRGKIDRDEYNYSCVLVPVCFAKKGEGGRGMLRVETVLRRHGGAS